MGTINHECVIATTWDQKTMDRAKEWCGNLNDKEKSLFSFTRGLVNLNETLFLAPDCSKKGWETAQKGDELRERLIEFLETFDYEDGSSPWSWVEVGYGEYGQTILKGNNSNCFNDNKEYHNE